MWEEGPSLLFTAAAVQSTYASPYFIVPVARELLARAKKEKKRGGRWRFDLDATT